jgi:hypothetical protein
LDIKESIGLHFISRMRDDANLSLQYITTTKGGGFLRLIKNQFLCGFWAFLCGIEIGYQQPNKQ